MTALRMTAGWKRVGHYVGMPYVAEVSIMPLVYGYLPAERSAGTAQYGKRPGLIGLRK